MKPINYMDLDKKYNLEEYLLLKNKFMPPSPLSEAIYDYLYKEDILLFRSQKKYKSVSEWLRNYCKIFFEVMFIMPLDSMPLYINDVWEITQVVAIWRLEINK